MKNLFKLLPFALLALGLTACDNNDDPEYTLRVLTFEDRDYKGTDNGGKGFADWSSLIDAKEYDGALLYPKDEGGTWIYNWNDADNTFLASELADSRGDRQFWGGGHAVSNYVETDIAQCDYTRQLSVCFAANGGHNGSKNFCIHNGANDNVAKQPSFRFMDGKERVVDHMWVVNTSYALNSMKNGDWSGGPFAEGDWLKIVATGLNAAGTQTGTCEFYLAKDTDIVADWTRWDLSSLGKVARIAFTMEGSRTGEWGLNTPAYFAYDDVAVRFE